MTNRNLLRGLFLLFFSLFFLLQGLGYSLGSADQIGPGLFPVVVAGALSCIALAMIVGALATESARFHFEVKNIGVILVALVTFALVSIYVNMILATVVLVFVASLAADSYSVRRNLMIAASLIGIALAFQKLLGLDLPLY